MADVLETTVSRLAPRADAPLTHEQRTTISRLEQFEAPYLETRLLSDGVFETKHAYKEAFTEFKRYAGLFAAFKEPLGMLSKQVDEVWHQFILFTKKYHNFCDNFLGDYMHHVPGTPDSPVSPESKELFVKRYNEVFGDLHPIWDRNAPCTNCCSESDCASCGNDGNGGED